MGPNVTENGESLYLINRYQLTDTCLQPHVEFMLKEPPAEHFWGLTCALFLQLTDHLKVFHELKGSVYPAAWVKARSIVIPPGLPQSPGADLEQLPSGYRHPSVES